MSTLTPRPYQAEAMAAVEAAWNRGVRRPAIVAATGAGKTVIFASLIDRFLSVLPNRRVLVLAHRDELLDQAQRKIHDVAPDLKVGKVAAGDNYTWGTDVVVGSVATLRNPKRHAALTEDGRKVGLIITDECHHATSQSYRTVYDAFPGALHLGVTATMVRADKARLGDVWDEICYEIGIVSLIRQGYLSDVRALRIEVADLDLSGVASRGGDFVDSQLGEAMELSSAPEMVAKAFLEHAGDRSSILFAPTVAVAESMAYHLNEAGVVTEVLSGMTPKHERRMMLRRYESGITQVLANCGVLTEGTDLPRTSCIVMARPTKSASLFTQCVGRGLRPYPGKEYALLLDLAGATENNNLCSMSTLAGRSVAEGQSLEEADDERLTEEAQAEQAAESGLGLIGFDEQIAAEAMSQPWRPTALAHREVDLFAGSTWRWRRTKGGVHYISTGTRYWFLMPGEAGEGWDVGWLAVKGHVDGQPGGSLREGVSELGTAMGWAERAANMDEGADVIGGKERSWHKRKASDKQIEFARKLGVVVADDARALDVSDAIDHVMASRVIDSRILPHLVSTGRLAPGETLTGERVTATA